MLGDSWVEYCCTWFTIFGFLLCMMVILIDRILQWEEQRERKRQWKVKNEKRKEDSEEKIRRFSQNQPCVSHLSAAWSSNDSSRRRPRNTRVMRYFKEFKSPRFKSSTSLFLSGVVFQ
jgi:biopolymer transport protein ExbB/TolQ